MTTPHRRQYPASPRHSGQHFGHITGYRRATRGHTGDDAAYLVRDDESGRTYRFSPAEIVTEGFRALRQGEHVRFLLDPADAGRACYVIRLDQPDTIDYYR
jgi:hypothetical protein